MFAIKESFEYLDALVERIAEADVPMPYATNLERMVVGFDEIWRLESMGFVLLR